MLETFLGMGVHPRKPAYDHPYKDYTYADSWSLNKDSNWTFFILYLYWFINAKAKSQFKRRSTANNVEIQIPVPNDADSPKFKTSVGSVKWVPESGHVVWTIKSFPVSNNIVV